ncbi:suppressor protein SRP40-like [Helianthus annuus]|uniref:suppressor protein SRP40-like n=1 Tax=Helianthus annuus TaxID=4232 RepID=UPI0016531E04|nr:suppressor protein SRP40-like [Helianthus annuus]
MNPHWWGTPSNAESKYRSTGLSPSWAESPTPPRITAEQWASVTNQKQSELKMTTDLYAPSSLDPRNCSQTKTAFYAKIVKDASNGESSRNYDSSEHDSSSVEDVSTSIEDVTTSSSSKDGSECESSKEVVDSDADRSTSESDSSQKKKKDVTCIGYKKCPPPIKHDYSSMSDEENKPHFEPSVSLSLEEFTIGLGYKKEVSSDSDVSADTDVSSAEQNQDPPVIVEDADSSDDESEDTNSEQSETVTKEKTYLSRITFFVIHLQNRL